MNLYFVVAYSHKGNEFARFILTASHDGEAQREVLEGLSRDWNIRRTELICVVGVNESIFKEV